jgi:hypothetical protein
LNSETRNVFAGDEAFEVGLSDHVLGPEPGWALEEAERIREQATVALLGLGVKAARRPTAGGSEVKHG